MASSRHFFVVFAMAFSRDFSRNLFKLIQPQDFIKLHLEFERGGGGLEIC